MSDSPVDQPVTQVNLQLVALEHVVMRLLIMQAGEDHEGWMERFRDVARRDVAMWEAPNLSAADNERAREIIQGHIERLTRGVIDLSVRH